VINDHGLEPFLRGAATGQRALAVFHLLFFVFTEELYATVIALLGLLGIAHSLFRRDYLLPLWMIIPFFAEGRSAAGPAAIPLAMLAAIGLIDVVFAALIPQGRSALVEKKVAEGQAPPLKATGLRETSFGAEQVFSGERNLFIYLLFYLIFSTYQFGLQLSSATLYPPDREAMQWVRENTSDRSRFLVLTGTTSVSCDSVLEWFPAITSRQSIYTVQGTEWLEGENFNSYVESTYPVQECLTSGGADCLDSAVSRAEYDYIYFSKLLRVDNCRPLSFPRTFPYFLENMRENDAFAVIYETDHVVVYAKR
jgi:hypothetical protein